MLHGRGGRKPAAIGFSQLQMGYGLGRAILGGRQSFHGIPASAVAMQFLAAAFLMDSAIIHEALGGFPLPEWPGCVCFS